MVSKTKYSTKFCYKVTKNLRIKSKTKVNEVHIIHEIEMSKLPISKTSIPEFI